MRTARQRRRLTALVAAFAVVGSMLASAVPVAAKEKVVPMPGEYVLSDAQRKLALDTMSPAEKAVHGHLFKDDADGLLLGYVRREYEVKKSEDEVEITEIDRFDERAPTAFHVPDTTVAAQTTGTKPGTKLLTSLVIYKTRSTSPYKWYVETYVDWGPKASDTPGIDADTPVDVLAMAWGGNLYIQSNSTMGNYFPCGGGMTGPSALNIWTSDITPNVGIEFEFEDYSHCTSGGVYILNETNLALGNAYIRETTWKNQTHNIASKYVHTYNSGTIGVSVSATGPTISVSGTASKWSLALSLPFAH